MKDISLLVLGAVLGYASGWLKTRNDERWHRKAISIALRLELKRLQKTLTYLQGEHWRGGKGGAILPTPMLDRFLENVHLFKSPAVHCVLDIQGFTNELQYKLHIIRHSEVEEEKHRYVKEIKGVCGKGIEQIIKVDQFLNF